MGGLTPATKMTASRPSRRTVMNGSRKRAHFPPWASDLCRALSSPRACSSAAGVETFLSFLFRLNIDMIEVDSFGSDWWNAAWSLMRHLARDRSIRLRGRGSERERAGWSAMGRTRECRR